MGRVRDRAIDSTGTAICSSSISVSCPGGSFDYRDETHARSVDGRYESGMTSSSSPRRGRLRPALEVGMRYDGGDGATGAVVQSDTELGRHGKR